MNNNVELIKLQKKYRLKNPDVSKLLNVSYHLVKSWHRKKTDRTYRQVKDRYLYQLQLILYCAQNTPIESLRSNPAPFDIETLIKIKLLPSFLLKKGK